MNGGPCRVLLSEGSILQIQTGGSQGLYPDWSFPLPAAAVIPIIDLFPQDLAMKGKIRNSSKLLVIAVAVTAVITMLLPGSASVLCVAPGGHVAIENLDSDCCAHIALPLTYEGPETPALDLPGDCGNCADYILTPNGLEPCRASSSRISCGECFEYCLLPADPFYPTSGSSADSDISAPVPIFCLLPLRC
jgi:hypothetical protein